MSDLFKELFPRPLGTVEYVFVFTIVYLSIGLMISHFVEREGVPREKKRAFYKKLGLSGLVFLFVGLTFAAWKSHQTARENSITIPKWLMQEYIKPEKIQDFVVDD